MPPNAFIILDYWHQDLVQNVGSCLAETVVCLAPACHQTNLAGEIDIRRRQADGNDVVLVEDRAVEMKQCHIKSVRLGQHVSKQYNIFHLMQ